MNSHGYAHPLYAQSLDEFGTPLELPKSRSWLIQRSIGGESIEDAMGCYPLFCCRDWSVLLNDLNEMDRQLLSVTVVTDPFGNYDKAGLQSCFERVLPFKEHFVVDLEQPLERFVSQTHLNFARRAQRQMRIELCADPLSLLDDWCQLHETLIVRKGISGIRAFSRHAFERQLVIPGIIMFRASVGDETIGLDWWYVQGDVAQGHLVVMSPLGYELHAGYALKLAVLDYFKGRLNWINLGGVSGAEDNELDGLAAFKRGWSSGTRTAWLCGRILDAKAYADVLQRKGIDSDTRYFPAYRQGELT